MKTGRLRIAMLVWSYWPGHEGGAERQCRKLIPHLAARGMDVVVCTAWTQGGHVRNERREDHGIVRLGRVVPLFMSVRRWLEKALGKISRTGGAACISPPGEGTGPTACGAPHGGIPPAVGRVPPRGGFSDFRKRLGGEQSRSRARVREALLFWLSLLPTWGARCSFLAGLWLWLRRPENRPDVIHVHESSWLAGAAALLAGRYGIPVLAKTAVFPAWNVLGYDVPLRGTLSRARRNCYFAALAGHQEEDLRAKGVPPDRVFRVPNGVDVPAEAADLSSRGVLFVGNFSQSVEEKAFDVLLEAWSAVARKDPVARLVMLGDGDASPWKALAESLGIGPSVRFVGWASEPSEYYRRAALFVLPSRSEGMSNALLEAQSWGLPCVASDIPGNRAVVEDGVNGLLVPVGHAPALAEAMLRLLADEPLRKKLGGRARDRARSDFSLAAVADRLGEIYRSLAEGKLR
ncbi:MAG: glycosyltransferase family 4 protein [Kiritimatiellia bacterium]